MIKNKLKIILVISLLGMLILHISYSYATGKVNNIKEMKFFEVEKNEVAIGEKIKMTINIDKVKYEKFEFKLQSDCNISNLEINEKDVSIKKENNEIERYCQKLDTDSKNYLKKIGLVRYNAYKDTGSNLSFALAILNEHNTGIVLNGIYGRDTSNIYAKPIVEGKCEYALSNEEKDALDKAIK